MSDKIFRDPLYNYIGIDKDTDGWMLKLLACPEVQRLRRIHQLGVSNLTYSGADHNRLAHSMGVVHLMRHVLDHLERTSGDRQIKAARMRLLAAALLHDVGHGPFSHLFEPCLGINHEEWSVAVILDESSDVHDKLSKVDPYLPGQVADLISDGEKKPAPWQKALLSSQLDVDRLDYLRRDSLFTGAGYGHFDWYRLLNTVEFHGEEPGLVWPEKTALAIEEYIFARYYMYQNVYLHKTTRGFEQLLQAMWRRAEKLRRAGVNVAAVPVLADFWKCEKPTPASVPCDLYLQIEEFTVLSQIQAWTRHADKVLSDLARRFLNRDGFGVVDPPPADPLDPDYSEWESAAHEILRKAGYPDPPSYCLADTVKAKYRTPYKPEKELTEQSAVNAIRINVAGASAPIEISNYLPRLQSVTNRPLDGVRYYVPKERRAEIQQLTRGWKGTPGPLFK